jgi:hypothetical protein
MLISMPWSAMATMVKSGAIQDYTCQWCGRRISERKGTVMYCLKTATARVEMVLKGLGEGLI